MMVAAVVFLTTWTCVSSLRSLGRIRMTSSDVSTGLYFREKLQQHPQLSSMLSSEVGKYGMLTALSKEYLREGKANEGRELAIQAVKAAEMTNEDSSIYAAYAKGILADTLYAEERYEEAANLYAESLKAYEEHYKGIASPDSIENAGAVQLLSWSLLEEGKYKEALEVCRKSLELCIALFGADATEVAGSKANLATARMFNGLFDEVTENLLKSAQKIYADHDEYGDTFEYTRTCYALATFYFFSRQYDKVENEMMKALELGDEVNPELMSFLGALRDHEDWTFSMPEE